MMNILTINLVLSTLVFWTAAKIYLVPQLARLRPETILAAYGDLVTAALAMTAILAGTPRALVWTFNVVGTVDLLLALALAIAFGAPDFMGAAYWIPAFWVPALLVTHYLVFVLLTRHYIGNPRAEGLKPS